ncbi:phytanoyl-CoA dioxygenase [Aureococcus anophagefferens]|uniref:Phytanoyl-CoA dioxygenase n=1 Tax=Aureococcus anophagefferens TaxID=44056 RepID=A0ABR1GD75_AURAN
MANGDSAKTDDGAAAKGAEPKKEPEASKWGDDEEEETAPLKSENGSAGAMKKTGSWAAIAKTGAPEEDEAAPPPPPVERTPSDKTKSPRDKGGKGERGPGRGKDAKGDGRGTPRAKGEGRGRARADDGKLLSEQPGSANRRTRGTGTGERHAGTVVYICASYGFIRMDTSDGAKEEDVFMHLVDVDFAPTIKERVTFELARFRERNKAVEVRQCEPGAKRSPPAKAKASVEDPAKEWPKAERLALAADLVAWLEGGAPPGALEAPGELLLASDDVARFFDAHAGHAAAVTRSTLAPSLAVKRAIREQGVAGVAGRVLELAPVPNGCNAGIVKVGTRRARGATATSQRTAQAGEPARRARRRRARAAGVGVAARRRRRRGRQLLGVPRRRAAAGAAAAPAAGAEESKADGGGGGAAPAADDPPPLEDAPAPAPAPAAAPAEEAEEAPAEEGGGGRRRSQRAAAMGAWARMRADGGPVVAPRRERAAGWMQATGRKELAAGDLPLFARRAPTTRADLAEACGASAGALEYVGGDVVCRLKAGTYAKPPPAPPAAPPLRPAADDGKAEAEEASAPRERKPPREPRTGPAADKFIVRRLRTMFLGGLRWDEGKGPATDAELGGGRDRQLAYAEFADDATMQAALDACAHAAQRLRRPLGRRQGAPAGDDARPPAARAPKRAPPATRARAAPRATARHARGARAARRGDKPGDKPADAAAASETKPGGAADAAAAAAPAADAAPQTTKA